MDAFGFWLWSRRKLIWLASVPEYRVVRQCTFWMTRHSANKLTAHTHLQLAHNRMIWRVMHLLTRVSCSAMHEIASIWWQQHLAENAKGQQIIAVIVSKQPTVMLLCLEESKWFVAYIATAFLFSVYISIKEKDKGKKGKKRQGLWSDLTTNVHKAWYGPLFESAFSFISTLFQLPIPFFPTDVTLMHIRSSHVCAL